MWLQWLALSLLLIITAAVITSLYYDRFTYKTEDYETLLSKHKCPEEYMEEMAEINRKNIKDLIAPKAGSLNTIRGNQLIRPDLVGKYGRFTITCLSVGYRPFTEYTLRTVKRYAAKKNYPVIIRRETVEIPNRIPNPDIMDANWQKLFWLRELIDRIDTEYLMWIDDDILVTNTDVDLESFIHRDPGNDIYISYDHWSDDFFFPKKPIFNSGVMIIKNTAGSRRILDAAIATYYSYNGWLWGDFSDQTAVEYVYLTTNGEGFSVIPHGSLQSLATVLGEFKEGDFLLHMAGLSTKRRLELCKLHFKKEEV